MELREDRPLYILRRLNIGIRETKSGGVVCMEELHRVQWELETLVMSQ